MLLSVLVLFVPLLLPLLFELLLKAGYGSPSDFLLEPASVMLTAPLLAVGVGLASRFEGLFGIALVAAVCFAVMYGAETTKEKPREASPVSASSQLEPRRPVGSISPPSISESTQQTQERPPGFWTRVGVSYLPERISWFGILTMTVLFIAERLVRHIKSTEPFEFEWER
jgi:hypothetical protein